MTRRAAMAGMIAAASAMLAGCASTTVTALNVLEPGSGVTLIRDIAYAAGPRHELDVYAPRRTDTPAPVVVFLYGGGWDSGEKSIYRFVGKALASHGYVVVIPDYRIFPDLYPSFLQDSALAVRWARDHAKAYGGDPHALFLAGHSAGAYNAVMLGLDQRWLGAVGMDPKRDIKGVVGLAGPYDFLPLQSARLKEIFGPEDRRPDTQPINHVSPGAPPMFLAHDAGDTVVAVKNTNNLAAKLQASGDTVDTHIYTGLDHARLVGVIASPLRFMGPVFRDLTAFIDAQSSSRKDHKAAA